jgi:N-acetylglucosaminyldiphosphoundecaprenol N-acetyl-beta-D-mannosaminyltransferase
MVNRNTSFSRDVWCILGLPLDNVTLRQAMEIISASVYQQKKLFLSTPNLNFAMAARSDRDFRESIIHSDLSIADGMPLIWVARILRIPLPERVAGADIMLALQREKLAKPVSVFFFGGEQGVGQRACEELRHCPGGLLPVGSYYPGFGSLEEMSQEAVIQAINASSPGILAVALGAKKGQAWIEHNRRRLDVCVISHLGAVVNFFAGSIRRAPYWVRKFGLEWLWRIIQEPKLWQRYLHDGRMFIWLLITRVLPYAIWLRLPHGKKKHHFPPQAILTESSNHVSLKLSGHCEHGLIANIRDTFAQAAAYRRACVIDLAKIDYIDGAFIGLIFLLRKELEGKELRIINVDKRLFRIFYWNCVEFLLEDPKCRTSEEASEHEPVTSGQST